MHILFLTHYFPPEVNAPASRTFEHCRAWVKAGHEVTVITCAPNHPQGKLHEGYRNRFFQVETVEGIRVVRVWTLLASNEGFSRRTLNYLTYAMSAVFAAPRVRRPDVIVSTSPQFFCGLAGMPFKWMRWAPWVLEIRDLWPESIVSVGAMKKGAAIRFLEWVERRAYANADHIVSVTDSFVDHIAQNGGRADRVDVIKNGVDLSLFKGSGDGDEIKRRYGMEGRVVAAYVGTHGMAHALHTVLEAADRLKDDPRIGFLLVGDGAERQNLLEKAEALKLDNLRIVGQLPKAEMPAIWAATDVSLIHLRRSDTFKKVLPSKMFEAMAMACPIVLGVEGEAKSLLEEAGAGIAMTPESAEELAAAVTRLADDRTLAGEFGSQGQAYVRENFDRAKLAQQYLEMLEAVVARKAKGRTGDLAHGAGGAH